MFKKEQLYICDEKFPTWLIYRNLFFDQVVSQLDLAIFTAIRDREISSKHLSEKGHFEVIRACNIPRNGHDAGDLLFLKSEVAPHAAKSYQNLDQALVAPNLSYYPRATWLKKGQLVDGSAAVLSPKVDLTDRDISFFGSDVFFFFYRVARNYSTRSLNIDKLSVFYWGLPTRNSKLQYNSKFVARSADKFLLPMQTLDLSDFQR
jgi:DNA (cytosine-5)-methyltransferase 1